MSFDRKSPFPGQFIKESGKTSIKTDPLSVGDGPSFSMLAIDQGLTLTGFALWEKGVISRHGVFRPGGCSLMSRSIHFEQRLFDWIDEYRPTLIVHETCGAMARSAQATRGVILAEYIVERVCFIRKQKCARAHQEIVKKMIASKTRLIEMKRKNLRDSLRPMKSDVRQAVCEITGLPADYFFSDDHADAIGIMLLAIHHFECLEEGATK